jgi:hypothetical protein
MSTVFRLGDNAKVYLSRSSFHGFDTVVEAGVAAQLNVNRISVTAPLTELKSNFPMLDGIAEAEILRARSEVQRAPDALKELTLRNTKLGQWLSEQKFTDWGRLVIEITRFLS